MSVPEAAISLVWISGAGGHPKMSARSKPPRRGGTVLIRMAQQVGHSLTGR